MLAEELHEKVLYESVDGTFYVNPSSEQSVVVTRQHSAENSEGGTFYRIRSFPDAEAGNVKPLFDFQIDVFQYSDCSNMVAK